MWLLYRAIMRAWRWYVERIVCMHFCTFKKAGSALRYTHVHILCRAFIKAAREAKGDDPDFLIDMPTGPAGFGMMSGPDGSGSAPGPGGLGSAPGSGWSALPCGNVREEDKDANGLGHDDETDISDPGHVTVSVRGRCRIQAEDGSTVALRGKEFVTAYFHQCRDKEQCPPGHRRIKCTCVFAKNEKDTLWVCYTLDHAAWQAWYDAQR